MRKLLLIATLAALAPGCSGSLVQPQTTANSATAVAAFDSGGSWMLPSAARQDLLYVSDAHGSVDVFDYPSGKPVGLLKGFNSPAGLCSDKAGDVYVVDTNNLELMKFKHGGTKPIKLLYTFGFYPFSCAVDPASGDVAVADISSQKQGAGALSIFHDGQGLPSSYGDPSVFSFLFCSYDDRGNVLVDGMNYGTTETLFATLAKGSTQFSAVTLDQKIGYPGGIQWDGTQFAIQDTTKSQVLYRVKIAGSKGKTVGTTLFKGDRDTLLHQFWIDGSTIVMPYGTVARMTRKVGFWRYPAGGLPTKSLTWKNATEFVGVTISLAN